MFELNREPMQISYSIKKDESEIICHKCGQPLIMKKIEYYHRHDGGNELESYMAIDQDRVWELYGSKYHDTCVNPKMDKMYGKNTSVKCKTPDSACSYRENGDYSVYCPIGGNEDVVVLCHEMS